MIPPTPKNKVTRMTKTPNPPTQKPAQPASRRRSRRAPIVLAAIAALVLGLVGWWFVGTRPAGEPQAIELADATLPARLTDATVLAVGEATHGTREFRTAWRLVAEKAAPAGFTTIALEENAGPVSQVDAWVQGGGGTAEEAVGRFGFRLNRTQEMVEFVTMLRTWNEQHPDQRIRLYGLDMQRPVADRDVVLAWLGGVDPASAASFAERLAPLTDDTVWEKDAASRLKPVAEELLASVEAAAAHRSDDAALRARLSARTLLQGLTRGSVGITSYERDAALHENLGFLVDQRAAAQGTHTLLLAHNGHVDRSGQSTMVPGAKLGVLNAERWGEGYRVIGSDAHVTRLQDSGAEFSFTVSSPVRGLFAGTDIGFLDLADASPRNREVLDRSMPSATAGSPFADWQQWVPFSHEISVVPSRAWDALVYVEDSHPTTPLKR